MYQLPRTPPPPRPRTLFQSFPALDSLPHLFGFLQNRSGYLKNSEGLARGSAGGPGAIASAFAGAGVDF